MTASPAVLQLLDHPLPAASPPRYLRALRYQYRFSTAVERHQTGLWWQRQYRGIYQPTIALQMDVDSADETPIEIPPEY